MENPAGIPANEVRPRMDKRRFWQLNTFIVLAMGCNLINFLFDIADGMMKSAVIEVAGILILFGFMWFNIKGMIDVPKMLSIFFVNAHSTFLCYFQGSSQGSYLYLFPFVMAMIYFLRVRKNDIGVTLFIFATTLNLSWIVLMMPTVSTLEPVSEAVRNRHFVLNILLTFLLVCIFFYFVLRLLDFKERRNKRDIAALKLVEIELMSAKDKAEKAAAAKARFMSNMSHELRTPLNAIIGTTHLLIQEQESLHESDHFKVLKDSSEHMLQLVNAVLDFSKLDEGKLVFVQEAFDLEQALTKAAEAFIPVVQQKNIPLYLLTDPLPEGKKVVGDEMRLKQVLLNLLSNAVKFTESGSVTLRSKIVSVTDSNAEIRLSVEDTGIGIPPEKLAMIFESFTQADAETTRKYGGSGLGLSICRELVRKMGSELQVKSEPGKGSVFFFDVLLPFEQRVMMVPKEKLRGLQKLTGVRILLVEDNAVNMKIARRFLHSWGASINTAENGQIAWDLFQQQPYDLLLVDLEMPLMDGKALLTQVRNVNKEVPAIAFTAAVYENMYDDLQKHGFNGYLHKPFRPDEMHRKILRHIVKK
ncbi:MAG TPA: ATP-binding protein [Puia sp.]|uniref:ATP-binding protein n=1 Tax=Puia sp. TaxID=2045100 RepID=UPI002B8E6FE2|nr:ATP-binding protein [Puia sp.]HVU95993.1 ATP-binding protein [Puia sp.]